jgi:S1-C subfamily serine protease
MRSPKLLGVCLAVCLAAVVAQSQKQPAGSLPPLADLQKLNFESAASPKLSGAPSYADLQTAIHSFHVFHDGSGDVAGWKWDEPLKTRGPRESAVYQRAVNAVVYILAATEPPHEGKMPVVIGTGAIMAPDDLVLTNWHVTRVAYQGGFPIIVYLKPARGVQPIEDLAYAAHVEFYNDTKDMSLLRFDEHPPYHLAELKIAPISSIVVGESVHVIGHPRGQTWSYSTGVVSQIRGNYKAVLRNEGGKEEGRFEANVLQLQTAISPGNSGGPVLDDYANIIGLISFGLSDAQNVNYAIAADEIDGFLQRHDARMGVQPNPWGSPQAEYSVAPAPGGGHVVKAQYPGRTAYLIVDADGKVQGIVADAGNGVSIQAWQPAASGGFQQWRARFSDGKTAEGSGESGRPTRFVIHKQ